MQDTSSPDHKIDMRRRSSFAASVKSIIQRKSFARAFSSVKIQTHTDLRTGLPVDYDTFYSSPNVLSSLIDKFEKKVQADRFLSDEEYDSELFARLKSNIVICQKLAPTRDFGSIQCNGIRMLLNHAECYFSVAVKKKWTKDLRDFLEVIKVMDTWFKMIADLKHINSTSK